MHMFQRCLNKAQIYVKDSMVSTWGNYHQQILQDYRFHFNVGLHILRNIRGIISLSTLLPPCQQNPSVP